MSRHQITRVRHDTIRRNLTVTRIETVTPKMLRIHLFSPDLSNFVSASSDDHVKLFFKTDDQTTKPVPGYHMRDYTPRYFDTEARTLALDFAIHDAGPATEWALNAREGDVLEIGGPRGSVVVPDDFDWYLLIGDETALPAIGRRVEQLRPGVPVITVAVVDDEAEQQTFETSAVWTPVWLSRNRETLDDGALFTRALSELELPDGEGFIWIAAEALAAKAARGYVLDTLKHNPQWMKAAGYWLRGEAGAHTNFEDSQGGRGEGRPPQ